MYWAGTILLLAAGVLAYFAFDVVALRVDAWCNPWSEADNRAFQIVQSLYAVAAGGLLGKVLGKVFPTIFPLSTPILPLPLLPKNGAYLVLWSSFSVLLYWRIVVCGWLI